MKRPPLTRWLGIVLRAVHTASVILLGAALLNGDPSGMAVAAVLATGGALFALDLWVFPGHLFELSALSVLVKLVLVALMAVDSAWQLPLFWIVVRGVFPCACDPAPPAIYP